MCVCVSVYVCVNSINFEGANAPLEFNYRAHVRCQSTKHNNNQTSGILLVFVENILSTAGFMSIGQLVGSPPQLLDANCFFHTFMQG